MDVRTSLRMTVWNVRWNDGEGVSWNDGEGVRFAPEVTISNHFGSEAFS